MSSWKTTMNLVKKFTLTWNVIKPSSRAAISTITIESTPSVNTFRETYVAIYSDQGLA